MRGLSTDGNLRFKIDWASLIVGSEFTVFALFFFVFEGNFLSTSPRGAYTWKGDLTEGFLRYRCGGLIFGGAYIRSGLSTERNLRFKIDWASLIVERKFTMFALFCFVLTGNVQVQTPGGLIVGGAI